MARKTYSCLGCASLHSILYKITFIVLTLFFTPYGCKDKVESDAIKPDPTSKNDFSKLISFETAASQSDLRFLAVDSISKNLLMLFGKPGGKITKIGILEGTRLTTVETNEASFYPLKYSIVDGNLKASLILKKVDNQLAELEVVNESTKKSELTKGVELPKEVVALLPDLRKIFDNDLKSARISSVQCAVTNTALKYIMSMNCLFRGVAPAINKSLLLIISPESTPIIEKQLEKHCEQGFAPVTGECREYGVDPSDLLNSCIKVYTKDGVLDPTCIKDLPDELIRRWNDFKKHMSPGAGVGDPHLTTFDGIPYDLQHVGEFIAVKSTSDNLEIQTRQSEYNKTGVVSVNTGIAIQTGTDVVCVTVKPNKLYINKQLQDLAALTTLSIKDGASITKSKENKVDVLNVRNKNGDLIKIVFRSSEYLDYFVYLSDNRKGKLIGLLGNYDGNRDNDILIRNGENILKNGRLSANELNLYADSWRIAQASSLFYYDAGKNTDSYTEKAFPRTQATLTADQKAKAESTCRAAGVTSEPFLSNCIVDVAITNNPDMVSSSLWGQQENKFPASKPIPVVIEEIEVKRIVSLLTSSFILKTDETLWVSGINRDGQFGTGQPVTYTTDNKFVKIMDGVKDIAAGMDGAHMLFLKKDGLWAAGDNRYGEIGNGSTGNEKVLTAVKIMSDAKAMAIAGYSSYVVKNDGTLWTFGVNTYGQLGDGTKISRSSPVKVMSDVKAISAAGEHALALKTDNSLWGFGGNHFGALGISKDQYPMVLSPTKLMDDVKTMTAGQRYSMVIKNNKELWVSGDNYAGQLGSGNYNDLTAFKKTMDNVADATTSYEWSLILQENNSLWSTGRNLTGSLGLSSTSAAYSTPVQSMSDVKYVVTGYGGTFIVKTDKSLWAVGSNTYGRLGLGSTGGGLSFSKVTVK